MTDDEGLKLRVALADADLILEWRERQLTAAWTAVAEERDRCAEADDYARALAAAILDGVRRAYDMRRAALDARAYAEAAWMNAKSGRYAAQEHALVCRGAMRDARAALVVALGGG